MAYQRFNRANDIVENQRTTISSGLWSGGSSELTAFYTQSTNGNITGSFLELYNEDPNLSSSAEVQFAVGYAHLEGSGSKGNTTKLTDGGRQTAALYRQFRNVLLAPNTDRFEFTSSSIQLKNWQFKELPSFNFNIIEHFVYITPLKLSLSMENVSSTKCVTDEQAYPSCCKRSTANTKSSVCIFFHLLLMVITSFFVG